MPFDPKAAYLDDGLGTASPEKLLLLLWDRLLLDLDVAEAALVAGDLHGACGRLVHAQDIVFELRNTLRVEAWSGAESLASIYAFVEGRLVEANVRKDVEILRACRTILQPLRDAFHEAAASANATLEPLGATA